MPARGRPVVVVDLRPQDREVALTGGTELQRYLRRRRRPAEQELLAAGQLQAHQAPGMPRQHRDQWLQLHPLPPETAAHRHRHHAHLPPCDPEGLGDRRDDLARALGRRPDGDHPVAVHPGADHVRFQVGVVDARHRIGAEHRGRGRRPAGLQVAAAGGDPGGDVAHRLPGLGLLGGGRAVDRSLAGLVGLLGQHARSPLGDRLADAEHRWQGVVLHLDQRRGVPGRRRGGRQDRRHRLPGVVDAASRHRLGRMVLGEAQVFAGDHGDHARGRRRRLGADGGEVAAGDVAQHQLDVGQPGQVHVFGEEEGAVDLGCSLGPAHAGLRYSVGC